MALAAFGDRSLRGELQGALDLGALCVLEDRRLLGLQKLGTHATSRGQLLWGVV